MGWSDGKHFDHEGYEVGYVKRPAPCAEMLRELDCPEDAAPRDDVVAVGAGCTCGWRSSRWVARGGRARYIPYVPVLDPMDEARACDAWNLHIVDVSSGRVP
jgi:hypothetical protein